MPACCTPHVVQGHRPASLFFRTSLPPPPPPLPLQKKKKWHRLHVSAVHVGGVVHVGVENFNVVRDVGRICGEVDRVKPW